VAVYREFGAPGDPGVVFFAGSGFLEVSGHSAGTAGPTVMLWLQVRMLTLSMSGWPRPVPAFFVHR
jgi:hypothetical protein